jgi:hypothetical protein
MAVAFLGWRHEDWNHWLQKASPTLVPFGQRDRSKSLDSTGKGSVGILGRPISGCSIVERGLIPYKNSRWCIEIKILVSHCPSR